MADMRYLLEVLMSSFEGWLVLGLLAWAIVMLAILGVRVGRALVQYLATGWSHKA